VKSVLRLKKNDHLVVFDGSGCEYQALIREVAGDWLTLEILKKILFKENRPDHHLPGLPNQAKWISSFRRLRSLAQTGSFLSNRSDRFPGFPQISEFRRY